MKIKTFHDTSKSLREAITKAQEQAQEFMESTIEHTLMEVVIRAHPDVVSVQAQTIVETYPDETAWYSHIITVVYE